MEKKSWRPVEWELWNKGLRIVLIPVLIWGMLFAAGVRPAQAADETIVNDWVSLVSAFANSDDGTTIQLGDDIAQSNGMLTVPIGRELTLDLAGKELTITASDGPAIRVEDGAAFIIKDESETESGKLTARTTQGSSAGIGGGDGGTGGLIKIEGGTVEVTGGDYGAGIGGGNDGSGGTITITGGKITAIGGFQAAGIGGGSRGSGGMITITGGVVTARGGGGAGIGGGSAGGSGGTITITGGEVTASSSGNGAGIGGGPGGSGGAITITDGKVTASSGNGAGIGGGWQASGGIITIEGGIVEARGGLRAPGIGGGPNNYDYGDGGTITITGGIVIPSSGSPSEVSVIGAGLGSRDISFILENAGTIIIPEGHQLIIPEGVTVTNRGNINGDGSIAGQGGIDNSDGFITVDVDVPNVIGNKFTLHFDLNDGSGSILPVTVYALTLQEAGATLPEPARTGYEFEGWYTEPDGEVEFTVTDPVSDGITIYARWTYVRPTVTLSTNAGDPTNGWFTVTATFNQDVTGFTVDGVVVSNGIAGNFREGNGTTYMFDVTPADDGQVTVEVPSGAAADEAGNGNAASVPLTLMYDGTEPTLTLSTTAGELTNGLITVTATFSENVTGFTVDSVLVSNGIAGNFSEEDGTTYMFDVTPEADGQVTVEVPSGAAADEAGNGNAASVPLTRMYDGTEPTLTLSTTAGESTNGLITVTATFSENVTGFTVDSVLVSNGTAGNFSEENGTTYMFDVTPEADGQVTVEVPSGAAADEAGNGNAASVPLTRMYDGTEPVIAIDPPGSTDPAQSVESFVTVTDASGLSALAYVWTPNEAAPSLDGPAWQPFASGTTLAQTSGDGDWYLHLYAMDEAGNDLTASFGPFVIDNTAPVMVLHGDLSLVIAVGSAFVDPGATAEDAQDGDLTSAISVMGSVNANTVGTYDLTYLVTDSAGNAAPEASRTVHVIAPPVLALNGLTEITIGQGSAWSDPGATATDAYYGDLSDDLITLSGAVDTQTPGVYTLRYTVENPIGQSAEAIRTVTVTRTPATPPGGPDNGGGNNSDEHQDGESESGQTNAVDIALNGLSVSVDAVTETTGDGQTVVRLRLTPEQASGLFSATEEAVVAVTGIGDMVVLELPAEALREVARMHPDARLQVIVDGNGLLLPLRAVERTPAAAVVTVTIGRASAADSDAVRGAINDLGAEAMMAQPIVYALEADGRALESWNDAYQERTMTLSAATDPHQATAVWIDEHRQLHFVPSVFADGGRAVTLRTRQDGLYTVIRLEQTFADAREHWAKADIERMANKLIITGRETGEFAPSDPVTRAEFAALLVRGLGLPEREGRPFADVAATEWYAAAVGTASDAGLIGGYEDGSFRPQERITREQMAVMIVRALAYAGQALQADAAGPGAFSDATEIAEWAKEAVAQLAGTDIIQGVTATEFAPQADASRAQSAVIINRLLQHLGFVNL